MNQRAIIHIIFAVLGIPVLITIGIWSATDPLYAGVAAIIVIGIVVLSQLGKKVWLLIPLLAAFSGAVNILPGHFAPRDLAVGVAAAILPPIWVMKRFPIRFRLGSIEVALLALFAFVGQAYFRNPVGLSIFGSGVIGGRPYFELVVSVVAFLILSVQIVDFKSIRLMIFANFAGSVALPIYNTMLGLFPSLAIYGAGIYQSGTTSRAISEHLLGSDPNQGLGRRAYLARFSRPIMNLILAFKSPLQLIVPKNFGYLLLAAFAGVCVLLGGFRSGVAGYGMLVIVAAILHRKPIQLVVMGLIGGPVIAVLLVLQGAVIELPSPAQRALSFLPADWNDDAVENAQDSSEWRFEMWEVALSSDRYIRNKWFGDGFGFTARELDYQMELMMTGMAPSDMQDYYLTTGTFHSGPVETIKRVGYMGLLALLVVMGVFFKESLGLVNRARGTPYFPYAVFVAMPLLILPFKFALIFGAFQGAVSGLLLAGGMMRMIDTSLTKWKAARAAESLPEGAVTR